MTAISVAAKKAFNRISISCKSNCRTISDINQASKIIQNAFDDCEWYQFKTAIKRRSLSKTHLPHLKGFCAAIHVLLRGSGSTKPSPFHFKNYIITKISFCQDETVCFYGCTCRFVKQVGQGEIQRKQQVFLSERASQEGAKVSRWSGFGE